MRFSDLINCYKNIFVESRIVEPCAVAGRYSLFLKEEDRTAKLKQVEVKNVPKDAFAVSFQGINIGNHLTKVFQEDFLKSGICKCCDYVLLSTDGNGTHMTFIELKSTNVDGSNVRKQFIGARCFIEYYSAFDYAKSEFSPGLLKYRKKYVVLSYNNPEKRQTKRKYTDHSTPDSFRHRPMGKQAKSLIEYNELVL